MKEIVDRYDIEAKVLGYRLATHFGINQFASMKKEDQPEPAYSSYVSIVLKTEIQEPKKQEGYTLELDKIESLLGIANELCESRFFKKMRAT